MSDFCEPGVAQQASDEASKAILRPGWTGATKLRQVVTPFRAILVHAADRGMIPFAPKIATPTVEKSATVAFKPEQVIDLIRSAAPHLRAMLTFAVGTGARPAEYLDLEWPDVDLRGQQVTLRTKGGGTRRYTMPPIVIRALESLPHRVGAVFQTEDGKRYRDTDRQGGGQFKTAWAGACRRAGVPGEVQDLHSERP